MNQQDPPAPQGDSSEETPAVDAGRPTPAASVKASVEASRPGDPAQEAELWQDRPSWKHYMPSVFVWLIFVTVFLVLFFKYRSETWSGSVTTWTVLIVVGATGLFVWGRVLTRVLMFRYRLTTQRLFVERGILSKVIDQTELIRVDDVRVRKSIFDRMFGLGTVEVISTDATDTLLLINGVADPEHVMEAIRTNMRQRRNERALFVENL